MIKHQEKKAPSVRTDKNSNPVLTLEILEWADIHYKTISKEIKSKLENFNRDLEMMSDEIVAEKYSFAPFSCQQYLAAKFKMLTFLEFKTFILLLVFFWHTENENQTLH